VSLSTGNVLDMYKAIGWELGIAVERSRSSAHHAIRIEVSRLAKEAKQLPVLVVDEAHHLRCDVLEDLRLLTNFAMDSENRMCLILVGLTELRRRLAMAVYESLIRRPACPSALRTRRADGDVGVLVLAARAAGRRRYHPGDPESPGP